MANLNDLEELSRVDIENVAVLSLVDIETVNIDISMSAEQRMMKYLEEIKNPYCFLCGTTPVKITFAENGTELGEKMKRFFLRTKR